MGWEEGEDWILIRDAMLFNKSNRTWPTVYVLMRTYAPSVTSTEFFEKWKVTLASVYSNKKDYEKKGGRVVLVINDDTPRCAWGPYRAYQFTLIRTLVEAGFASTDYILRESNGMGSAYGTHQVRQAFLNASDNDDDIAVTLDQDDLLKPKALRHIAERMKAPGIVISPFDLKDRDNLDIMDDGGRRHNVMARRWRCIRSRILKWNQQFIPRNKYAKIVFPNSIYLIGDFFRSISHNIGKFFDQEWQFLCHLFTWRHNVYTFSSIGWTKAYSRKVLEQYYSDLSDFMDKERGKPSCKAGAGATRFFSEHRAYEDFIDFYSLLYSNVNIRGSLFKSHTYIKNKASITSTPTVGDFCNHRTASLIALIDLCYANENACFSDGKNRKLRKDFEYKLLRFVSSKVYQVDHIISDYRKKYSSEGDDNFAEFSALTHDGYFISKLSRLALGENRGTNQDAQLFQYKTGRGYKSRENFERLFSNDHINAVPEYGIKTSSASPRFALRKCVIEERRLAGIEKPAKDESDTEISKLYGTNLPPNQKRLRSLRCVILFWFIVLAGGAAMIYCRFDDDIQNYQQLLVGIISIWLAVLTYLLTERGKVKALAGEESSLQKLYYSEFIDFIRHLEANLKVMIQIRKQLKESESPFKVEEIHFANLKWPDSSCLFSDEMAKIISRERVDEFSRLKVNLRNINNSANWLQNVRNPDRDLVPKLEWEIARHFGYLLNMYYLRDNNFSFPTQNELDLFINENALKHKLSDLFMDYPSEERVEQVVFFFNMYYDDRRMRRAVLVF